MSADLTLEAPDLAGNGYRTLFEANPTPLYVFDRETLGFLAVNDAAVAKYGYSREEFRQMTLADLRPPEEVPRLLAYLRGESEGFAQPGRWRHRLRDGSTILVEIATHTLEFQGRPAEMVMATDVTELEETLVRLRASEERFRLLSRATSDAIWDWDLVSNVVWRSDGFNKLFQLHPGEAGTSIGAWAKRVHPEDRPAAVEGFFAAMASDDDRWEAEYRFARADGSYATVRDHAVFVREAGRLQRAIGGMADISASAEAAVALAESTRRHAEAYEALTWLTRSEILEAQDLPAVLRTITTRAAATLEVDRVSVWRYLPDRSAVRCDSLFNASEGTHTSGTLLAGDRYPAYFQALATGEVIAADDARADSRTREFTSDYLVPLGITAMLDAPIMVGGALAGVLCHEHVGTARSWTPDERSFAVSVANLVSLVLAQDARRQTERLLRQQASLLDQAQDAIMVWDAGGRVRYWSRGAERVYGWSAAEALGELVSALLCPGEGPLCGALQAVQARGEWTGELAHQTRSGGSVAVLARLRRLDEEEGAGAQAVLAICTDVTERKKLEQQFLRAQRLESIGILAGGIAHDLNNVLTPILMSIDLLRSREADPGRLEVLGSMEASARHGAEMIRQVLSFARGTEGQQGRVDVDHLLRQIGHVVSDTFLKRITLDLALEAGLQPVSGDLTQLHQVLMNLCVNARDAMPEGGTLRLAARNIDLHETSGLHRGEVAPGPFVMIEVTDTGAGMSPEVVERIFDPFFTTKEPGKGTGLGLSTSLAIVEGHGGFIRVSSEPDQGTTFRIYLPAEPHALPAIRPAPKSANPRGKDELILVVDDEAAIREITRQILERFGYRVITAAEGGEALETYGARHEEIALVLTDMRMPGMDGPTLARHLRLLNPQVRILGASGLQTENAGAQPARPGLVGMLAKPYTASELLSAVRSGLDTPLQLLATVPQH